MAEEQDQPEKIKAEREKGAAPPAYMPSIFGWLTVDAQQEQAKEIVDFIEELDKENKENKS